MKKVITILILITAVFALSAQDVVRNGGFEETNHMQHWMVAANPSGASVEGTNSQHHSGSWSAQFNTGTTPSGDWTFLFQDLYNVQNDKDYKCTFFVKGTLSANNSFAIYGVKNGDTPLGIDGSNSNSHQTASDGKIKITTTQFNDWTEIIYYWYSGNFQNYDEYKMQFQQAADGTNHTSFLDDFSSPQGTVSIEEVDPDDMLHLQLYPNPAADNTNIRFYLEGSGKVTLEVFTTAGERVDLLANDVMSSGDHAIQYSTMDLPAGVYFMKLSSGTQTQMTKLLVVR